MRHYNPYAFHKLLVPGSHATCSCTPTASVLSYLNVGGGGEER